MGSLLLSTISAMVWWLTGSISIAESLFFITVLWSNVAHYYTLLDY
jgi:hypothetical protein